MGEFMVEAWREATGEGVLLVGLGEADWMEVDWKRTASTGPRYIGEVEKLVLFGRGGFDVIGADCNSSRYGSGWGIGGKVGEAL